jgi:hypothetical protein
MNTVQAEPFAAERIKTRGRPQLKDLSVREVVCAVESITHTIHTRSVTQENQHAWAYDSTTRFVRCSERIAPEDLLPGDMITILCEKRGEILFAKSIRVHLPALHLFPDRLTKATVGRLHKKAA